MMYYERNGNYFVVKENKGRHYIALLFGYARVSGWKQISKKKLSTCYKRVENYNGDPDKFKDLKGE